ncbi:bacterial transcriptional activator domain-containing protein [Paenibacillus sp. SAFN-117]
MQLYEELGDRSSVERQYESLKTMLSTEYDAEPQPEINEWYQAWKEGQAQKLEEHRSN